MTRGPTRAVGSVHQSTHFSLVGPLTYYDAQCMLCSECLTLLGYVIVPPLLCGPCIAIDLLGLPL